MQTYKLIIKNPDSIFKEQYLVLSSEPLAKIRAEIELYIVKNGQFNSVGFNEQHPNIQVIYFLDIEPIEVIVPKSVWNVDEA